MTQLREVITDYVLPTMSDTEIARRFATEIRHGDDDGTLRLCRKIMADRSVYDETDEPPKDSDHVCELHRYGLSVRAAERISDAGAVTIKQLRDGLEELLSWRQCGEVIRREAVEALANLRKAREG